jgi:hypothetical protein
MSDRLYEVFDVLEPHLNPAALPIDATAPLASVPFRRYRALYVQRGGTWFLASEDDRRLYATGKSQEEARAAFVVRLRIRVDAMLISHRSPLSVASVERVLLAAQAYPDGPDAMWAARLRRETNVPEGEP